MLVTTGEAQAVIICFFLAMTKETRIYKAPDEEVVERFVRDIIEAVHPLRIILFGSAVRGESHVESDLDLLVIVPDGTDRHQIARKLYRDIPRKGTSLDVLVATPSILERYKDNPGLIYRTILQEGREVYAA